MYPNILSSLKRLKFDLVYLHSELHHPTDQPAVGLSVEGEKTKMQTNWIENDQGYTQ